MELYVIAPDAVDPTWPFAVSRDGFVLNRYLTVEDAYAEFSTYGPTIVWDEPLTYLGERMEYDAAADTW